MASATPSLPLNSHRGSPASLSTSTTQTPPAHPQARRQDRATFLGQVFDMVSKRPANDPTLSWSKDGKSIVIWSQGNFEQDVLPAFFPMQKKLRTFLRAMQSFTFKRSTDKKGGISLTHPALSRQSPRADFLAARPKAESSTKEDSKPAVVDSGKNIARTKTSSTSQKHASSTLPSRSTLPIETPGANAFQLAAMYCTTCCRLPPAWTQYHYPDVGGVLRCNWCAQEYYLPSTSNVSATATPPPPQNHNQSGGFSAPMATPPASTSPQPPKSKRKRESANADIPHTDVDRDTKRIKAIDEKNYDSATSASSAPNSLVSTASTDLAQSLTTTSMPNTRPVRSISPQSVATAPTGIPPLSSPPSSESCATGCNQIIGDRSGLVRKPLHSQSPPVTSEPTVMLDSDVLSFSERKVIFTTSNTIANDVTPTSESPRPKIPSPILSPRGEDSSSIRQKKLLRVRFADEDMNMHGSRSTNTPTIARTTSQSHQRRRYECHHEGCGISYSQPAALQWHQARVGHVG